MRSCPTLVDIPQGNYEDLFETYEYFYRDTHTFQQFLNYILADWVKSNYREPPT